MTTRLTAGMVGALAMVLTGPDTLTARADAVDDEYQDLRHEVRDDRYPGSVPGFGYGYPPARLTDWSERRNFVPPPTIAPSQIAPQNAPPQIAQPIRPPQPGPFDDLLRNHGLGQLVPAYPNNPPEHRDRDPYRYQRPRTYYYYPSLPSVTLSPCQQSVSERLRYHFGAGTGTMSLSGSPYQGIVILGGRSFNYRCTSTQVDIW